MLSLATSHIAHLCNQLNHVALPNFMARFKSIIFYQNSSKVKVFLHKNSKFSSAGGSAPRPPCLLRLGALPPDPQPPAAGGFAPRPPCLRRLGALLPDPQPLAAGGFAPRPPLASGGWGLRPQPPKTAPHCEFLATRLYLAACLRKIRRHRQDSLNFMIAPCTIIHAPLALSLCGIYRTKLFVR